MKLSYKIFLFIIGIVLIAIVLTNVFFSLNAKQSIIKGVANEAHRIADDAALIVSKREYLHQEYTQLINDSSQAPKHKISIDSILREIRNDYASYGVENVYTIVSINDQLLVAGDPSEESELPLTTTDYANLELKHNILTTGISASLSEPYTDDYGVWMSAYSPIINHQDKVVAIIGIDVPLGAYDIIDTQVSRTLLYTLLPCSGLAALLSLLISRNISGPINDVVDAIENIRSGNLNTRINFRRKDEIGTIGTAFNRMAEDLEEKERIKNTLNKAVSPAIAQKILHDDINPHGELMEGTVLFADVRDFTHLSDSIAAKDTIAYINEFLNICVPATQDHGGIIEKFVGDEVFAVFGGPIPLDNDAEMAVKTAISIQAKLTQLNEQKRKEKLPTLDVGIGICTGVMIGGVIGTSNRNNYTLLGSTVNEGARICSLAKSGEVIISQSTYLRVQRIFEVDQLPPIKVKGKEFSIQTFSVKNIKA